MCFLRAGQGTKEKVKTKRSTDIAKRRGYHVVFDIKQSTTSEKNIDQVIICADQRS